MYYVSKLYISTSRDLDIPSSEIKPSIMRSGIWIKPSDL